LGGVRTAKTEVAVEGRIALLLISTIVLILPRLLQLHALNQQSFDLTKFEPQVRIFSH